MRRRSFLAVAGSALCCPLPKAAAQTSLGTLVWVQPEGLWRRELPDGQQMRLVSGGPFHDPRFSPSGDWIAYRKGEERLLVVRNDGRAGASFAGDSSMWLPDDRLAIHNGSDVAIFSPVDGWKNSMVWKGTSLGQISPDGRQYAAERIHERPADANGLNQDRAELYVASLAGQYQMERVLVADHEGDLQPFAWTRDGTSLIYWRADEWSASIWADGIDLYMIPALGGAQRKLGIGSLAKVDMLELAPEAAGNKLAVTWSGGRETWADQQIVIVDLNDGSTRELTPKDISALCPAWSPDGRTIAYFAAPDAAAAQVKAIAGTNIRVMRPDGTVTTMQVRPQTRIGIGGDEAHPFMQQRKIWLVDADGGSPPRQLTSDPQYRDEEPQWSRDGSHILFGRMDYEGHTSLWLMESSGGNARPACQLAIYDDYFGFGKADSWFGYYGYTAWRSAFDWRR